MPTTLQTKFLEDSQGNKYAPVTTPNAVRWANGDDLDDKLGEKQDEISDLASIRSGASAGASAYQKPLTGIPASDLESGVIPASLPASDVYAWAKAATKPAYSLSEVGATASVVAITTNTSSSCSITGGSNDGKTQTIIYTNSTASDLTVTVPTTYQTPDGQAIELTCKAGGYCEVSYINVNGTIYARGI